MTNLFPVPQVRCELPSPDIYAVELPQGLVALVDERVEDDYLAKFGEYLQLSLGQPGSPRPAPALSESEARAIAAAAASSSKEIRRESRGGFSVVGSDVTDPPDGQTHEAATAQPSAATMKKGIRINIDPGRPFSPMADVRTDIAHTARVYDYLLGGKDNYMPDRDVGDGLRHNFPEILEGVRSQRSFMHRSVRFLAEQGVDQFLDIGTGIPTSPNLHEIAQSANPGAKVMYVDNDPIVLAHSAALMLSTKEGSVHYLEADARKPRSIVDHFSSLGSMKMKNPTSVSAIGILHFLANEDVENILHTIMDAMPPGSYLTISQASEAAVGGVSAYREAGIEVYLRTLDQIQELCTGLEFVDPGIVPAHQWRPDESVHNSIIADRDIGLLALVARKP